VLLLLATTVDGCKLELKAPLRWAPTECERVLKALLQQGDMARGAPEVLPQCTPTEGMAGHGHDTLPVTNGNHTN